MAIELSSVVERDAKFWRMLGDRCVNLMKRVTDRGVDYAGESFPPYSASYAEAKAAKAMKRQASRRVNPPDLRLSGDMMRDLKTQSADATGAVIGWAAFGDRATWNADMGRAIIDFGNIENPHPQLAAAVLEAISIDTNEKLEKWAKEPININIGRS